MSIETIHFMNVDLDVLSRSALEPLAAAFGNAVCVLHVGREGKIFAAHFELADSFQKDANELMQGFVDLVGGLSPNGRKLWNGARCRVFNIGIQSALKPHCHELQLSAQTLAAVARVRASITITTYAPARDALPRPITAVRKRTSR